MLIKRLLLIHWNYLFNKRNIYVLSISFLLLQIISIYYFLSYQNSNLNNELRINVIFQNIVNIDKLIFGTLIIFIMGNSNIKVNDEYQVLFIDGKISRQLFYLTKYLSLFLFIIGLMIINFILLIIIGILIDHHFYFKIDYLLVFINLLFICLIYGYISSITSTISNSLFSIIIIIILFNIADFWSNKDILSLFLPSLNPINYYIDYSNMIVAILYQLLVIVLNIEYKH